uniref:C2H2-type domain-containing protein n=1 Tax=Musca domestica TaxID=7370 RepID=A0A1I8MIU9_MUSDO
MGKDCLETSLEVVDEVNPVHEDEKTNVEEINIISRDHMEMKNPTTQEEYVLEEKEYGNDLFKDPPCDDQLQCDESPKLSSKSRGQPPYICGYGNCKRQFNRWVYYEKHLKHHNCSTVIFKCDVNNCNRKYKNKSALNIHQRKAHNIGPELKQHMCEKCGKVFKSSTVLKDHSFTHVDRSELPYVCNEADCSKKFSTKEKLKIHKLRHAGVRNYICPHCGMRKTTRNELKIHINYHTLERTWPCQFCSKVCNSAGNLKMHVRNIHERTKDFACSYCERTFAKADTRKYHEMTHTGEKPHACEICGRRFLQPAALRTHRKIHRKIENSTDSKEVGT